MTFYSVFFWCLIGFIVGAIVSFAFWVFVMTQAIKQGKMTIKNEKDKDE